MQGALNPNDENGTYNMVITVEGYADMRKYTTHLSPEGALEIPEGITVGDVLEQLEVPSESKKVIIVNGRHKTTEYILQPGDALIFFPPLEGG
jgi:molybdopterin converting factor small subunit